MTSSSQPTCLIVDDEDFNREIFRDVVESAGYTANEAVDGPSALKALSNITYTLLILDLVMPEMDGIGVLRRIRTDHRHSSMKVVVATADPGMANETVSSLSDHVVFKPINVHTFKELVESIRDDA